MVNRRILIVVSIFAAAIALLLYGARTNHTSSGYAVSHIEPTAGAETTDYGIGGAFTMTDHDGRTVTDADFLGGYNLVFFGFTHCPDVCPAGLQKIARTLELLEDRQEKLQPLFVTVDPARDQPEIMKEYVAQFHPRIVGLTGNQQQTDEMVSAYKAYVSVPPAAHEGHGHDDHHSYLIDHSAFIYLLDPDNRVIELFSSHDSAADMAARLNALLDS